MGTGRAKARAPNRNTGTHGGGTRDARTPRRPRARRGSTSRRVADREDEQGGGELRSRGRGGDSTEMQRNRREPADPGDPAAARHAQMLLLPPAGQG
jgi:hypothetical protein